MKCWRVSRNSLTRSAAIEQAAYLAPLGFTSWDRLTGCGKTHDSYQAMPSGMAQVLAMHEAFRPSAFSVFRRLDFHFGRRQCLPSLGTRRLRRFRRLRTGSPNFNAVVLVVEYDVRHGV